MLFAVNFKPKIVSIGRIFSVMFSFINTYPAHSFFKV